MVASHALLLGTPLIFIESCSSTWRRDYCPTSAVYWYQDPAEGRCKIAYVAQEHPKRYSAAGGRRTETHDICTTRLTCDPLPRGCVTRNRVAVTPQVLF